MTFGVIAGSIEQGLVYGLMALGVYLSFRVLSFPDLTVDGSFPLGGAVAATLIVAGQPPILATLWGAAAGLAAGTVTGLLHTRLRISGLLAGILTMTALYSINLRVMGRANVPLLRKPTILQDLEQLGLPQAYAALIAFGGLVLAAKLALDWFLHTEYGLALRATGDNDQMVRSLGVDTRTTTVVGLSLSNGLVAFSGALVAQYQGFADAGMGIGTIVAGLASVIIGEVLLRPGSVVMATLAAVFGSVVYRLAIFFALRGGFAPTDLKLVTAILVVLALSAPTLREGWSARARRARRGVAEVPGGAGDLGDLPGAGRAGAPARGEVRSVAGD